MNKSDIESLLKTGLKDYLGDSVYASYDRYHIVLTTENGFGISNTIYLESNVMDALRRYEKRIEDLIKMYHSANNE